MSNIIFEQTKLKLNGKQGKSTPDKDGYYTVIVGGLNVYNNTHSWYYTAEKAKELFGPGSLIDRKIKNGVLKAEVNHPRRQVGEKLEDFWDRMADTDLNNVCGHFRKVWLDMDFGKNHPEYKNPNMIVIMAEFRPSGAKGDIIKDALDNQFENVCFSVRSLADEVLVAGRRVRTLTDIIGFDYVNEGGLTFASKWDTPSIECIDSTPIVKELLQKHAQNRQGMFSLESTDISSYMLSKYFTETNKPIYNGW